jgi:hypothetical protein
MDDIMLILHTDALHIVLKLLMLDRESLSHIGNMNIMLVRVHGAQVSCLGQRLMPAMLQGVEDSKLRVRQWPQVLRKQRVRISITSGRRIWP